MKLMRRIFSGFLSFVVLTGLPVLVPANQIIGKPINFDRAETTQQIIGNNSKTPYTISLQSRQFIPHPGIEQSVRNRMMVSNDLPTTFLVQFYSSPTQEDKALYEEQDILLLNYIPDRAWIVKMQGTSINTLYSTGKVRWIGSLYPSDRVSPDLSIPSVINMVKNPNNDFLQLIVEFLPGVTIEKAHQIVLNHGAVVVDEIKAIKALMILVPSATWVNLAYEEDVSWIEPPTPSFQPYNDGVRSAIGVDILQAPPYGLDGSGVNLLVYDSGSVNPDHPAFSSRLIIGDSMDSGLLVGNAHATHVAGTAAGDGTDSPAGRDLKGMAPGASIISYRFESYPNPNWLYMDPGDIEADWFAARILHGADLGTASIGVNVSADEDIPCSWNGNYGSVGQLIDEIVRGRFGEPYITTWATGNERGYTRCTGISEYNSIPPPANAKNPIHVGATDSDTDSITEFSSFGPSDDGRIKPTITAPGCELFGDGGIYSTIGVSYGVLCGTSMAAPAVAGLTALMIEQFHTSFGLPEENPLPSTIKAALIHTAVDLGNPGPDFQYGYGRVDGVKAVKIIEDQNFYEETFTSESEIHEYRYIISPETNELRVSIAWDDASAHPSSAVQLVNDLNLLVTSPTGQEYYPFVLDPANPSAEATTNEADNLNNQEQVVIPNPSPGTWTVSVSAFKLPIEQSYSIVFPGVSSSLIVTNVDPDYLPVSASDQTLTIEGLSFTNHSEVYWNGIKITNVTYVGPRELQALIPSFLLQSPGISEIYVQNPGRIPVQSEKYEIVIYWSNQITLPMVMRQ